MYGVDTPFGEDGETMEDGGYKALAIQSWMDEFDLQADELAFLDNDEKNLTDDEVGVSGMLDRVRVVYGFNQMALRATILDFKSDRIDPESQVSDTIERYRSQLKTCREALVQIL